MNESLIVLLIQNAGLLLAMVVVFDFVSARSRKVAAPLPLALVGVAIGVIGISMMQVSVPLQGGIVFDTRSVLLAVSGLFLGVVPTAIAATMAALFRLYLGGEGGLTGVLVIVAAAGAGLLWRRLRGGKLENITWRELYALGLLVHALMLGLMLTLPSHGAAIIRAVGIPVIIVHPLATVVVGLMFVRRLRYYNTAEELAESESRFRLLAENARDVIFRYELVPFRRFTYVSPSSTRFTGYTPEEYYADPELGLKLVHPLDRPTLEAARRGEVPPEQPLVLRWVRKDGDILWAEQRNTYIRDEEGNIVAVEGIVRDITGDKQADAMIRMALKASSQGLYDLNVQSGQVTVSEEYATMLGYARDDLHLTFESWLGMLHPDDVPAVVAAYDDYVAGRSSEYRVEFRQRTRGGEWRWILSLGSLVSWDAKGRPLRLIGTHTDITALKMAERRTLDAQAETARLLEDAEQSRRALLSLVEDQQAAERQLLAEQELAQSTLDALEEHICVLDESGTIIAVNSAWRLFGEANGARLASILPGANYLKVCELATGPEEHQARQVADALRALLERRLETFANEYSCDSPDQARCFQLHATHFTGGGQTRVVVAHQDISSRKNAESELRRLTEILQASQAAARIGGWELDLVSDTLVWTEETYRIHDTTPEQYQPTLTSAMRCFTAESGLVLQEVLRQAIEQGTERDVELELITFAGRHKWVQFTPSVRTEKGRTVRITCAIQDITARKQAERERLELTAQLHQVQKLESLGSLAGGVAHDMNNVLAAILSSASSQRTRLAESDPLSRTLDNIINASLRGRSVVRSLLYFARNDIESRGTVDLNAIAREIVQLLENTTLKRIRFSTELEDSLPVIEGDASALSHAVMNLCVNAVDAMPDGGLLAIRTATRVDGFAEIRVRDTGTGMTPEVQVKAVEPFFTTKPVGKGTGLGLAMVYGTVKAHRGTFEIDSAPSRGTEVVLAFPPQSGESAAELAPASAPEPRGASPGALNILLVDDDELIRDAVSALLEIHGHTVTLASGGSEALEMFKGGLQADVVLLDMNMPGLTGAETLERLLQIRPGQHVLLCTGQGDEAMARSISEHSHVLGLEKPFTLEELEAKLEALRSR